MMFDDALPPVDSARQIVDLAWAAGYGQVRLVSGEVISD
jgi:hypothetical protein